VKAGRNESCPCGSGLKYKMCCGRLAEPRAVDSAGLAALMNAGLFAELELAAEELLSRAPESGLHWQLLAHARRRQGKDALQALIRSVEYSPQDPVAHLNLGNELARRGRLEEALACYARALGIRPDFAEAHANVCGVHMEMVNLANARRSVGRLQDAVAGYRRVLEINPDHAAAQIELGTALRLQRRTDDCEAACRKALAVEPDSAAALTVLAELRADTGRFVEAEDLFNRVVGIDPQSADGWVGLARLRKMTPADSAWLAGASSLAEQGLPPPRELLLRYALGKYFDDIGEFDSAFRHYRRANQLARQCGPTHDRTQLTRNLDWIIRSHDAGWFARRRSTQNVSPRAVFIVGMLRSGTTLAEQILASHPSVFGAGELTYWAAGTAALISAAAAAGAPASTIGDATLADLAGSYLSMLQGLSPDADRVIDKLPTNFLLLGLIHAALPNARIIHMQRNPIDTCLSIYFQHFEAANTYANDLEDLAHYYREYRRLMRHWREVLPVDAMLEIPYEGLVADLPRWSRKMLDFLGLPWDARCLDFHCTARTVVTASRWQVRQKIDRSSVERWRHYEKFVGPLTSLLEMEPINRP
jgi:tetratricopeptide (TPR) repeat protein